MMSSSGLRARNREAAKVAVRTAAFALMNERTFATVTVEQIAAQARVSPSTVYRYFGTKEALVLSAQRPSLLVDRLRADTTKRSSFEAFHRAAVKVWGTDADVADELALAAANPPLLEAWERQLLDQRPPVADVFAGRRGATSANNKDRAGAAAALAILMTLLPRWQDAGGGKKDLDNILGKAFGIFG